MMSPSAITLSARMSPLRRESGAAVGTAGERRRSGTVGAGRTGERGRRGGGGWRLSGRGRLSRSGGAGWEA